MRLVHPLSDVLACAAKASWAPVVAAIRVALAVAGPWPVLDPSPRSRLLGPASGLLLVGLLRGGWLVAAAPASACTIPVHCYALEYWTADPYQLQVFHQGSPDAGARAQIASLAGRSSQSGGIANFAFEAVDLSAPLTDRQREAWDGMSARELPRLLVRSPLGITVWEGPLSAQSAERALDSPTRREVVRRLLDGDAGVWILLESGRAEEDAEAARVLDEALDRFSREGSPASAGDEGGDRASERAVPPFSRLRLSRSEPAEQVLVQMLLHSEPDLPTATSPMAFPVFGRGRALYALVGPGINAAMVREACSFLAGDCSCQIKELNPGTDLLMSVDWDERLREPGGDPCAWAVAEAARLQAGGTPTAAGPTGEAASDHGVFAVLWETSLGRNLLFVAVAGLGIIAIAVLVLARRR